MIKKTRAGYTLIEILIVIVIISIVSTVALLSLGRNKNRRIETLANQLTQMLTLAEEQALLQPAVLGLLINERSFVFLTYQASLNSKNMIWVPSDERSLQRHVIPDGIEIRVISSNTEDDSQLEAPATSAGDNPILKPQVVISPNGDLTPFTISIGKEGEPPRYIIRGEADGSITNTEQP